MRSFYPYNFKTYTNDKEFSFPTIQSTIDVIHDISKLSTFFYPTR